jgi:hypothetical protein
MNIQPPFILRSSLFVLHSSFGQPGLSADQPNSHEFGYDEPGIYFWMAASRVPGEAMGEKAHIDS